MILIETQPGHLVRSRAFRVDSHLGKGVRVRPGLKSIEAMAERVSKGVDLFPDKRCSPVKYAPRCGFS